MSTIRALALLSIAAGVAFAQQITTSSPLPNAVQGQAYNPTVQFQATGFSSLPQWTVSVGTLPVNMNLSPAGVLGGSPSAAGVYTFTVNASLVGSASSANKVFQLTVQQP